MNAFLITVFLASSLALSETELQRGDAEDLTRTSSGTAAYAGETHEEARIREAVEDYYIKGLKIRDFSLIRSICIDEAKLYGVRNDESLNSTTLDQWSKRFDPGNPPFRSLESEILSIDFVGKAAQVKIRFVVDEKLEIHDFLNMLKIENTWRIINIIDN